MKKLLPVLFVLLAAAATAQVPMNWSIDEVNIGQDITLSTDEELFTEGARSCHMQLNSGAVPYLVSDRFNVTAGTSYAFSIDVLDNDTTGQIKVYADFFDEVGNMVFGDDPEFSVNSAEWSTIQWQGTIPPNAVEGYVLIKFYCEPELTKFIDTAHVRVDNCKFLDQGGSNLFINGGFEQWAVGVEEPSFVAASARIFPNPAGDFVTVRTAENADLLQVFDLSGRMLMKEPMAGRSEIKLNLQGLPEGFYTLALFKGRSLVASAKLIRR
jgi:hypothetical protein